MFSNYELKTNNKQCLNRFLITIRAYTWHYMTSKETIYDRKRTLILMFEFNLTSVNTKCANCTCIDTEPIISN